MGVGGCGWAYVGVGMGGCGSGSGSTTSKPPVVQRAGEILCFNFVLNVRTTHIER